jgi:hypothetical protein
MSTVLFPVQGRITMRKALPMLLTAMLAAPALAQPAPAEQSPRQKFNYWTRCAAMFDIVGNGQRENGNMPEAQHWEGQAKLARDKIMAEALTLSVGKDDAEKAIASMVQQFTETLTTGDKSTEAQFGRAVDICSTSLLPEH